MSHGQVGCDGLTVVGGFVGCRGGVAGAGRDRAVEAAVMTAANTKSRGAPNSVVSGRNGGGGDNRRKRFAARKDCENASLREPVTDRLRLWTGRLTTAGDQAGSGRGAVRDRPEKVRVTRGSYNPGHGQVPAPSVVASATPHSAVG